MSLRTKRKFTIPAVIATFAVGTVAARRAGYSGMGGNTIVRCRNGHLFTTIWVPGASIKSIRLGPRRFQYCPVGRHWALVAPVKVAELSDADKQTASQQRDVRVP
jgi:hypothetical protein